MKIKIKNRSIWQEHVNEAIDKINTEREKQDAAYEEQWRNSFFGKIAIWCGASKPSTELFEYPSMFGYFGLPIIHNMYRALNVEGVEEIYFDEEELRVLARYVDIVDYPDN